MIKRTLAAYLTSICYRRFFELMLNTCLVMDVQFNVFISFIYAYVISLSKCLVCHFIIVSFLHQFMKHLYPFLGTFFICLYSLRKMMSLSIVLSIWGSLVL